MSDIPSQGKDIRRACVICGTFQFMRKKQIACSLNVNPSCRAFLAHRTRDKIESLNCTLRAGRIAKERFRLVREQRFKNLTPQQIYKMGYNAGYNRSKSNANNLCKSTS